MVAVLDSTTSRRVVSSASRGWRTRRGVAVIGGLLTPAAILVVWQLLSTSGAYTIAQLPPPVMVVQAGIDLAARGQLALYVGISTQRVILGFVIGGGLGILLGALVGLSRAWDVLLGTTLGAIRVVPSLAWVPLLILWMKIGEESKITLIAIGAFFPVYTTVSTALRHVDRQLVEASMGLGWLLTDSSNNGRTDRLFLAILLLAVVGKATDAVVAFVERRAIRRWS
jgi:sulfonate transport system permease protein